MNYKIKSVALIVMLLSCCSTPKEHVMPFVNFEYAGERLFPVAENDADFTFRAWVSLSTSIDRVFTISEDKNFGYEGKLLEIRGHSYGRTGKDKTKFKETKIKPYCGFKEFVAKVDSLNLLDLKDQIDSTFRPALHDPFSLFVIEIKEHGKTNQFKFRTYFPIKDTVESKYQKIQELILRQLPFTLYVNR